MLVKILSSKFVHTYRPGSENTKALCEIKNGPPRKQLFFIYTTFSLYKHLPQYKFVYFVVGHCWTCLYMFSEKNWALSAFGPYTMTHPAHALGRPAYLETTR